MFIVLLKVIVCVQSQILNVMRMLFRTMTALLAVALCLVSCRESTDQVLPEIKSEQVCVLDENIAILDAPKSLSVIDSKSFAIAAGESVVIYGFDGRQIKSFSKKGRGNYEYQNLSYVRGYGDRLYVWDSGRTKFIVYDKEGDGVAEYKYGSAIKDFVPYGNRLYIYTAGKRSDHIIDVFDMSDCAVVDSIVVTTPEHRLLLSNEATAPISVYDGYLYFMSKDALDVYRYPLDGGDVENLGRIASETFKVDRMDDDGIIGRDFMKAARYLFSNSYVLALSVGRRGFLALANEGEAELDKGMKVVNDNLKMTLYRVDAKLKHAEESSEKRSADIRTICSSDGAIYLLRHNVENENDRYTLEIIKD